RSVLLQADGTVDRRAGTIESDPLVARNLDWHLPRARALLRQADEIAVGSVRDRALHGIPRTGRDIDRWRREPREAGGVTSVLRARCRHERHEQYNDTAMEQHACSVAARALELQQQHFVTS